MLKSGDYARCYAHFLWLCSHLRSFFIVHYAKKGYSAQCCAHVFCCFACSSLSGETSPKVATQMARDHARLPPDVDTPILYYHPSSDSACKGSKHALALLRQWNYPQKNPRTIIPPQEYGTFYTTMDHVCRIIEHNTLICYFVCFWFGFRSYRFRSHASISSRAFLFCHLILQRCSTPPYTICSLKTFPQTFFCRVRRTAYTLAENDKNGTVGIGKWDKRKINVLTACRHCLLGVVCTSTWLGISTLEERFVNV